VAAIHGRRHHGAEPGKLLIEVTVDQPEFGRTYARIARAKGWR
jgi:hypothetical protein